MFYSCTYNYTTESDGNCVITKAMTLALMRFCQLWLCQKEVGRIFWDGHCSVEMKDLWEVLAGGQLEKYGWKMTSNNVGGESSSTFPPSVVASSELLQKFEQCAGWRVPRQRCRGLYFRFPFKTSNSIPHIQFPASSYQDFCLFLQKQFSTTGCSFKARWSFVFDCQQDREDLIPWNMCFLP